MSRCGCASNSCACLIVAGTGIDVSGTGGVEDPYIVESTGGGGGGGFTDAEIAALVDDSGSATGGAVLDVANDRVAAHVAAADPHSQYHTNSRGDIRYYTKAQVDALIAAIPPGGGGSGDVVGPAVAVNNRVAFFNGTSGKLIKDGGVLLSGNNTGDQTLAGLDGVALHGAQTIEDTKTFADPPVVPDDSFTEAKVQGLVGDLSDITDAITGKADLSSGHLLIAQWPAGGPMVAYCISGTWQPRPILLRTDVCCIYISPALADGDPPDFVTGKDILIQPTS